MVELHDERIMVVRWIQQQQQKCLLYEEGFCAEKLSRATRERELKHKAEIMDIIPTELHQINLN